MGDVYLARDLRLDRAVALKVLTLPVSVAASGTVKELFFITADGQLAVSTITSDPFEASAPTRLFQTRISPMLAPYRTAFGVSPDGQSFLMSNGPD